MDSGSNEESDENGSEHESASGSDIEEEASDPESDQDNFRSAEEDVSALGQDGPSALGADVIGQGGDGSGGKTSFPDFSVEFLSMMSDSDDARSSLDGDGEFGGCFEGMPDLNEHWSEDSSSDDDVDYPSFRSREMLPSVARALARGIPTIPSIPELDVPTESATSSEPNATPVDNNTEPEETTRTFAAEPSISNLEYPQKSRQ